MVAGLARIRSSWCQWLERGCLQETLCWGFVLKKELVMQRVWKAHSSSSRWPFSFHFHFPYSKRTKAGGPWIVVCTYSGIKVTQENKLFRDGDGQDCWCKILLELIFCVMSGGNIGGYTLTRANERPSTNQQPTTWRGHSSFAIPIGVDTTREAAVTSYKSLLNWCRAVRQGLLPTVGEGGLLPYISHKGMCSPMGYCFYATSV